MDQIIKSNQYSINYMDEAGDTIDVSNDEDLEAAYQIFDNYESLKKELKFTINILNLGIVKS